MLPLHLLDEDTVEALLAGRPVTPGLAPLAGAVGELRAAARQPVRPSAELAQRMASGDFSGISPAPLLPEPAPHRLRSWLAGVSPRARVVTGAVIVFTGLTAATATGALPGGAQAHMESFIETVTPISFQRDDPAPEPADIEDVRDPGSGRGDSATTEPDDSGTTEDPGSPVTKPPGKPETPPGKPDEPGNPDKPEGKPDEPPGKPDSPPGQEDRPAKPDKPEKPNDGTDAPGNSENSNGAGGSQGNGSGGNGNGNDNENRPDGSGR
ncbi:hypothetical protein [Jiangella mangrovi]|uniref:Membrane peptidoglycan carboxypeptidase n=1 Tax=Jiangella mangrovi TaxID=1524084 RepID=A0A7W9GQD6_9ACTN|nr:hypothetical protein [Jiangella mangrovi]MBB5787913.1 membrane peptidoglycan carboxypeptidase [Jiangella mangrovi]